MSPSAVINRKSPTIAFTGDFRAAFGEPQANGLWLIYGDSGNGKTSFALQLAKELCKDRSVIYESYEEGLASSNIKKLLEAHGLSNERKMRLTMDATPEELEKHLKTATPQAVIIDSLDIAPIESSKALHDMAVRHPNVLFIGLAWAEGRQPAKKMTTKVLYMSNQKIYVKGYRAFSRGRSTGEIGHLDIWPEGAAKFWGDKDAAASQTQENKVIKMAV
jgi:hypothetical protein